MDTNTYYNCECVYFDVGYILCKICATWAQSTTTIQPIFFWQALESEKQWVNQNVKKKTKFLLIV